MKLNFYAIAGLMLLAGCTKNDLSSFKTTNNAVNQSSLIAEAYASSKMEQALYAQYNWNNPVPIKSGEKLVAVKVMKNGNTPAEVGYLLVEHDSTGWGDIVQHTISYIQKNGRMQPVTITSISLLKHRSGTKTLTPATANVGTGPGKTKDQTLALVGPGGQGVMPMVTIEGIYSDGSVVSVNPTDYFLTSGGLGYSAAGGGLSNDYTNCAYLDPLNTASLGGSAGTNSTPAVIDLSTSRVVDGIYYTMDQYPYKEWGYPWAWWEDVVGNEPESGPLNEYDPNFEWWEQNPSTRGQKFPKQARPKFDLLYSKYPMKEVGPGKVDDMTPAEIAELLGGQIKAEFLGNPSLNFCCIRVSMALNKAGIEIPEVPDNTWKDKDGNNYIRGVDFLLQFLKETFDEPEVHYTSSQSSGSNLNMPTLLGGISNKGIYVMKPKNNGNFGATGHATLWCGFNCIGGKNFFGAASQVFIWQLPQ